jgi:hypothetical protein
MADKNIQIQIKAAVDTANASQNLGQLIKSLEELNTLQSQVGENSMEWKQLQTAISSTTNSISQMRQSGTDLNATFDQVYEGMAPLTTRMGEAEDRLYQLALAGKQASKEYKDLLAMTGKFKQAQQQTDAQVDSASKTLGTKMLGALQGVASGFAAVQGAMGLFGGESKKVQEALLKVNSAMALVQGIQGIRQAIPDLKSLKDTAVDALKGIRAGVAATGIGLLVIAVGLLVAYWDDIKAAVNGVSAEQEALNKKTRANVEAQNAKMESLSLQENSLRLQGKSEREILQMKIKQSDQQILALEAAITQAEATKKSQVEASQRNKDILKGIIMFLQAPLYLVLKTIDEIAEFAGFDTNLADGLVDMAASLVFDPKEVAAEADKAINEDKKALEQLKSQKAGFQLEIKNLDKQAADERKSEAKSEADKQKELRQEQLDALKGIIQRETDAVKEGEAAKVSAMADGIDKQIAELELSYSQERQAVIDRATENEIKKLDEKYVAGKMTEQQYRDELLKIQTNSSEKGVGILDEEKALLEQKEKAKNDAIKKIREDDRKLKEAAARQDVIKSAETAASAAAFELENTEKLGKDKFELIRKNEDAQLNLAKQKYEVGLLLALDNEAEKARVEEEYRQAKIKATQTAEKAITEIEKSEREKRLNDLKDSTKQVLDAIKSVTMEGSMAIGTALQGALGGITGFIDILKTDFEEGIQGTMDKINAYAQVVGGVLNSFVGAIAEANKSRLENEIDTIKEQTNAEKEELNKKYRNGLIDKAAYDKAFGDLDAKAKQKELEAKKKAFEQEKKTKIASAIISGLQGAVAAFTGAMSLGPIAGPIVGGVLAAAVAAMTAMNVAKIKSSKFDAGDVGAVSAPDVAAPGSAEGGGAAFQPTQFFGLGQGSSSSGGGNGGMSKVYVTETDITSTQNRVRVIEDRAVIG